MKKVFSIIMCGLMLLTVACTKKKDSLLEQSLKSDFAYMEKTYGEEFVWYEAQIVTNEWFDESNAVTVASVTNVFQYIEEGQPHVVMLKHYDGQCDTTITEDFWIEDCAIEPNNVIITFKDAYEQMMKSNFPKPHSQKCAIRKSVGPYDSNAQYTFGNIESTLYVDAKTGDVSLYDPAFVPKE